LIHVYRQADRQTDMAKLIDAFLQPVVSKGPNMKWEYNIKLDSDEIGT
jgi:hypothetical protein